MGSQWNCCHRSGRTSLSVNPGITFQSWASGHCRLCHCWFCEVTRLPITRTPPSSPAFPLTSVASFSVLPPKSTCLVIISVWRCPTDISYLTDSKLNQVFLPPSSLQFCSSTCVRHSLKKQKAVFLAAKARKQVSSLTPPFLKYGSYLLKSSLICLFSPIPTVTVTSYFNCCNCLLAGLLASNLAPLQSNPPPEWCF